MAGSTPQADRRTAAWETAVSGMLGAAVFALKMAMAQIPNIEPVSLAILLLAVCMGWRGLYAVYIYVLLEIAVWGPGLWAVPYLYIWLILFAAARALRRMESVFGWAALSGCFGLLFGALCAPVYWAAGGWQHAVSWWLAGIPMDLLHGAGNFALALFLFSPLKRRFSDLLNRRGFS